MAWLARQRSGSPQQDRWLPRFRGLDRDSVKRDGFTDAIVLGMGGSSLGPEVLSGTFERKMGWPALRILSGRNHGGRSGDRHCAHAVHRLQQIRKHDRAEHA